MLVIINQITILMENDLANSTVDGANAKYHYCGVEKETSKMQRDVI